MTLPTSPPRYGSWAEMVAPIKLGARGWPAYAVQTMVAVTPDGVFGPLTDKAVKAWQKAHFLTDDGVCGPATQATMLQQAGQRADRANRLPEGVGYGFAVGEGAGVLAATNWSVAGGVDSGAAQWRVYGPPYDATALRFAFNARMALDGAAGRLRAKQKEILLRGWWKDRPQTALRAAVLHHNWPVGSSEIVRSTRFDVPWYRRVSRPDDRATWVDGFTRAQWCKAYAESVLRFVV